MISSDIAGFTDGDIVTTDSGLVNAPYEARRMPTSKKVRETAENARICKYIEATAFNSLPLSLKQAIRNGKADKDSLYGGRMDAIRDEIDNQTTKVFMDLGVNVIWYDDYSDLSGILRIIIR